MEVMLPSHAKGRQNETDEKNAAIDDSPGNPLLGDTGGSNELQVGNQSHNRSISQRDRAEGQTYVNSLRHYASDDDLDEYGAELGKEAKVWRVYVREADRWDGELVDGWDKSLDVILVFAALFSAVSTAFIIESSSQLQEDPSKITADTLYLISQTLLMIANNTQSSGQERSPELTSTTSFDPSRTAVIVNTLWYMSLSLSLATSLLAMLAKDWCYSFKSNRSGDSRSQTVRRQRKWAMIERWKMRELILLLPSLIHLSLLLFAIGLAIYIWDLNETVAIPVVCISGAAIAFYFLSSIAASLVPYFPYSTGLSRILRSKAIINPINAGLRLAKQLLVSMKSATLVAAHFVFALFNLMKTGPQRLRKVRLRYCCFFCTGMNQPLGFLVAVILSCIPAGCYKCFYWPYPLIEATAKILFLIPKNLMKVLSTVTSKFTVLSGHGFGGATRFPITEVVQEEDQVVSEALSWLITNCETPTSVDIALQAIAGASSRIPRKPLEDCEAAMKILQRLVSSSRTSHSRNASAYLSLYVRAYEFLGVSNQKGTSTIDSREVKGELEVMIWDIQLKNESRVERLITESTKNFSPFVPSPHNLEALRIGSSAASQTLQLLASNGDSSKIFDAITLLTSRGLEKGHELHEAALASLVNATTLFSSCFINHPSPQPPLRPYSIAYYSCMHLVMRHQGQPSKAEPFWQESASYLVICALSRVYNNLPASTGDLPSCGVASRSTDGLRAIINHCNRSRDTPFAIDLRFLTWIGFSEVLSNPSRYGLDEHEAFQRMFSTWNADGRNEVNRYIEALYNSFPPYERSSGITDLKDMKVSPYLRAIEQVFKVAQLDNPTELVYIFVVEMMCRVKSDSIQELCAALMLKFTFPTISNAFIKLLRRRRIVSLLFITFYNVPKESKLGQFTAAELWLLFSLCGNQSAQNQRELTKVLKQPGEHDYTPIIAGSVEEARTTLGCQVLDNYNNQQGRRVDELESYLRRIVQKILEGKEHTWPGTPAGSTKDEPNQSTSSPPTFTSPFSLSDPSWGSSTRAAAGEDLVTRQPRGHHPMEILPPYGSRSDMA